MTLPNPRHKAMLDRMGIDVWRLHERTEQEPQTEQDPVGDPGQQKTNPSMAETDVNGSSRLETDNSETPTKIFGDLEDIAVSIRNCQQCSLHATRTKAVPGTGNASAEWMFVGEAPGQNEDEQGLPFVGRAGQLLDSIIHALGMERDNVFIANVIKCRPPGNRDPEAAEVSACESYLHAQLAVVRPKVIVALGRVSAQALLKRSDPLGRMRGQVYHYGADSTPMVVTYHPAYLLRSPAQKGLVWQDLLMARSVVGDLEAD